ncbi:Integrase core domain [Popillia japonica]|uniref:RNA-directed DNA polymerase n=1 Tax=Popillia japonica TaxID=7064 RepID=A0AAW1LX46_POPJA
MHVICQVSAIVDYPTPKTTTQIKRLIGLVGYYRRFLKTFSALSSPITDLLRGRKKGQPIIWTPEADKAFQEIKTALTTAPVLASPDFSQPFLINCDASDTGVGAVLYQAADGIEHPVAYASKNLNAAQRKYSTTEKELLAVIFAVEKFRSYVEDHASLVWLHNLSNPTGRLARWAIRLSQFDFAIQHRKGSLNVVADALSRTNNEVAVLDLSRLKTDRWYRDMVAKVKENPEKFPSFRVENNYLYKHILRVENNYLYKHILSRNPLGGNLSDWKIVVPTPHRGEILHKYHDAETAAHLGVSKTFNRIFELYYWPRMRQDIYKYVKKCKICASCKSSNLPKAGLMGSYKNINFPFQLISADLLGPYPRSQNGNQYLLVVVDWFTKYCLVHPLAKATSKAITKFLENQVFLVYGVPQIFVCDNGPQFRSSEFQNLMKEYKVQKVWYNARYHPQINATERQNRVIVTAIRSYVGQNHRTWDKSIPKLMQQKDKTVLL